MNRAAARCCCFHFFPALDVMLNYASFRARISTMRNRLIDRSGLSLSLPKAWRLFPWQ
jgi:hypothetical protein